MVGDSFNCTFSIFTFLCISSMIILKIIKKFTEYFLTRDEAYDYKTIIEVLIKSILKSPSSAKFPTFIDKYAMGKIDGEVTVQEYVDSQNTFGAMIRSDFQVKYDKNRNIKSFIFDGEELIKK